MKSEKLIPGLAVCDHEGRPFFIVGPHRAGPQIVKIGFESSHHPSGSTIVAAEVDELYPCTDLRKVLAMQELYARYIDSLKKKEHADVGKTKKTKRTAK